MQTKKYKVGFTTGIFDMFHIGHLNLLINAKELCEYLIVGIHTDDISIKYKNKKPIIPIEDRIKIIESLKVVDKVIKCDNVNKIKYYKDNKFNVLIAASDKKNIDYWIEYEKELKTHNVDIVYLPYTKKISSSKIRESIIKAKNKID